MKSNSTVSTQLTKLPTPMLTPQKINWISQWLQDWLPKCKYRIIPLVGDGSSRSFLRIQKETAKELPDSKKSSVETSDGEDSYILLYDPDWNQSKEYPVHQRYLERKNIPVPHFVHIDETSGILVMQDLGDAFLQTKANDPKELESWLIAAGQVLAQLHGNCFPIDLTLPAATRKFDQVKFLQELRFSFEHLVQGYLGGSPPSYAEEQAMEEFCHQLSALTPEVFCHRDYHSRNLLIHQNKLFMIDFQDARLGSPHYDLASLLYDAYIDITPEQRKKIFLAYQQEMKAFSLLYQEINWEDFSLALCKMGVQRTIKAAGSFASFFTRFQKTSHLPYIVPALTSAQRLLEQIESSPTHPLKKALLLQDWITQSQEKFYNEIKK